MNRESYDRRPPPSIFDRREDMHRYRGLGETTLLRGEPIDLEWAGWRSNTHHLQQAGWEFAESRRIAYDRMEESWLLQMRHPQLGLSGMNHSIHRISFSHRMRYRGAPVHLTVELGAPYVVSERRPVDMVAVDTQPHTYTIPRQYDLYHMPYFRPIESKNDIYLGEASVQELMDMALQKQLPNQEEVRKQIEMQHKREEYRAQTAARLIMVA